MKTVWVYVTNNTDDPADPQHIEYPLDFVDGRVLVEPGLIVAVEDSWELPEMDLRELVWTAAKVQDAFATRRVIRCGPWRAELRDQPESRHADWPAPFNAA